MKEFTFNAIICLLSCIVLLSCSKRNNGNLVKDAGSVEKSFDEYELIKPGKCNADIKIWKIGNQTTETKRVVITKSRNPIVKIQGLIRDLIVEDSGIALYADISGYRYKAITGIETTSILKYPKAGYLFEIPTENLEAGEQAITFYLIKTKGKAYCPITGALTLDVR